MQWPNATSVLPCNTGTSITTPGCDSPLLPARGSSSRVTTMTPWLNAIAGAARLPRAAPAKRKQIVSS